MSENVMQPKGNLKWGIAHIYSSRNNTLIYITDLSGAHTFAWSSSGSVAKVDREKKTPYAAMMAASKVAEEVMKQGINALSIKAR